jgi:DNA gyrase subunit A
MLITVGGQMVRTPVQHISVIGRNTQGVKLVNLDENDRLQAIAPVISEAGEEAAESVTNGPPPEPPQPPLPPTALAPG